MASLRKGQVAGWCRDRAFPRSRTGAKGLLLASARHSDNARGLPRLSPSPQGTWLFGQHDTHGPCASAGLSAVAVWRERSCVMASASISTARTLAYQGRSEHAGQFRQVAAYQVVSDLGAGNRRKSRGDTGPYMGPDRLSAWNDQLPATGANPDQQAPHRGSDEQPCESSTRRSAARGFVGLRDRVCRKAGEVGQEGNRTLGKGYRHSGKPTRAASHLRGLDGPSRRSDSANLAISGPHIRSRDGLRLRQIFAFIYGECGRCGGVLMYSGTKPLYGDVMKKPGNTGAAYVTRTRDPIITNDVLYRLS